MNVVFTGLTPHQAVEFLDWFEEKGEDQCANWFDIRSKVPGFTVDWDEFEDGNDQCVVLCRSSKDNL